MLVRIIADDLSGAADCSASFASEAGTMPVFLGNAPWGMNRYAVDTDSRAKDALAASLVCSRAMRLATAAQDDALIFKKIDSTLRGHIGIELSASLDAWPVLDGVVVSPAFPGQGRTLRHGKLFLDGCPSPEGAPSDLMEMLRKAGLRPALLGNAEVDRVSLARQIAEALRAGARAVVVDADSGDSLSRVAQAIAQLAPLRVLVAGSAGLARALAAHSQTSHGEGTSTSPGANAQTGPVVGVVGSFSAAAVAQVDGLADGAAEVIHCDPGQWLHRPSVDSRSRAIDRAEMQMAAGRNVVFAIRGAPTVQASHVLIRSIAATVAPLLQRAATLVLTGGDTARAVLECLGVQRLDVFGEFEPGISVSRCSSLPQTRIVIKAGAFGDPSTLRRVFAHFGANRQASREHKLHA
jgi:uncharacterized protein YgbK (DUF1537 family)